MSRSNHQRKAKDPRAGSRKTSRPPRGVCRRKSVDYFWVSPPGRPWSDATYKRLAALLSEMEKIPGFLASDIDSRDATHLDPRGGLWVACMPTNAMRRFRARITRVLGVRTVSQETFYERISRAGHK